MSNICHPLAVPVWPPVGENCVTGLGQLDCGICCVCWGGEILVDGRGLFWVVDSNPDNDPLLPQSFQMASTHSHWGVWLLIMLVAMARHRQWFEFYWKPARPHSGMEFILTRWPETQILGEFNQNPSIHLKIPNWQHEKVIERDWESESKRDCC